MGLLIDRFRAHRAPDRSARTAKTASLKATLAAIGQKIKCGGWNTLSVAESKVWNTAAVISYMSSGGGDHAPTNAKVLSWAAARARFEDMGLPTAVTFVTSLVTELAFRTEIDPRDRRSEADSLVRLATLKRQFSSIEEQHDLWDCCDSWPSESLSSRALSAEKRPQNESGGRKMKIPPSFEEEPFWVAWRNWRDAPIFDCMKAPKCKMSEWDHKLPPPPESSF